MSILLDLVIDSLAIIVMLVSLGLLLQILKAYRKSALKCHPDKNKDNPKAGKITHAHFTGIQVKLCMFVDLNL